MYKGGWKDGQQHGLGIFITAMGEENEGEWNNGDRIRWVDKKK